jgi:hypothetical protein
VGLDVGPLDQRREHPTEDGDGGVAAGCLVLLRGEVGSEEGLAVAPISEPVSLVSPVKVSVSKCKYSTSKEEHCMC